MSQATGFPGSGIRLGKSCVILSGIGSPSASSTPDVQGAGIGSLYLQTDIAGLFQCTAAGVYQNGVLVTASTWVQIS
jgi:hypothetical protein